MATVRSHSGLLTCALLVATAIALHLDEADRAAAQSSPSGCQPRNGTYRDPNTGWSWKKVHVCRNSKSAPLYASTSKGTVVGWMDTRTSWFACYSRGDVHGGRNDVWYYTQGDRAAPGQRDRRAWGYMPAEHLTTKVDPYPGIPECPRWAPLAHAACGSSGCVEPPGLVVEKQRLGPLRATFSGICGDELHNYGYHRAPNQIPRSDYSLRGARNKPVCQDHAAAIDIGMDWPASRTWLKWLIGEIRAG